jgi:phospholipid/cholesterol/gamma-HCH transport system substrate-binding protein
MGDDRRLGLVVGAFVLAAFAMLAGLILSLSAERGLFAERYALVARFDDVQGLLPGAPVRLAGKDVGSIHTVRFADLGEKRPPVEVTMQIDADVQSRIRSDSRATIGTIGLLGDTYVEIDVGTPAGEILEPGAEIPAVSPLNVNKIVAKGTVALDSIVELTDNLNTVVARRPSSRPPTSCRRSRPAKAFCTASCTANTKAPASRTWRSRWRRWNGSWRRSSRGRAFSTR